VSLIDVNDTTIYYERSGQGPSMLFVHGMFGHADVWADQTVRLSDHYACVRYDRRGHTRSARGNAAVNTSQHADDAAALIDALDLAPCLVVGSSGGALIAIDLALRYSELLRGVVLSEPPLFSLDPDAGQAFMSELAPRIEEAIASGGLRAGVDAFMSTVCMEMWLTLDDDRRDRLRDNAEISFTDLNAPPLEVEDADLAGVMVATSVVAGTTSLPVFRSVARRLAALLPDARVVEIVGGHVPYLEHPDTFAEVVKMFAAELDKRPATASS
jgi:3-oxoadipate enol-lactonase